MLAIPHESAQTRIFNDDDRCWRPALDALEKQPVTAVIGYGLGDFAMDLAFSMGTAFLSPTSPMSPA